MEDMAAGNQEPGGPAPGQPVPAQQHLTPDWERLWELASGEWGPWLVSRYDGHCRGCGQKFEAGELIRWYAPEQGYLAECCGVSPDS